MRIEKKPNPRRPQRGRFNLHAITRVGSIYLARSAVVVGDVAFGIDCNVWHHCVIRGDVAPINIKDRVNIQDGAILHCNNVVPLEIASDVAIGHGAVVHGKSVGRRTLIATRAIVLDDCEIGEDCLIAAGTLLPPGTIIPDGSVVIGVPGKIVHKIRDQQRDYIRRIVQVYLELAHRHAEGEFASYIETQGKDEMP